MEYFMSRQLLVFVLLLPLLSVFSSGFAMVKPFMPDDCPICFASVAKDIGRQSMRYTKCCKQAICSGDVDHMEYDAQRLYANLQSSSWRQQHANRHDFSGWPEEQEHAKCPFCRAYPLNVVTFDTSLCDICSVKKDNFEFIDLGCGHSYCRYCLVSVVDNALQKNDRSCLKCPGCRYSQLSVAFLDYDDVTYITVSQSKRNMIAKLLTLQSISHQKVTNACPGQNSSCICNNEHDGKEVCISPECVEKCCSSCLIQHADDISCKQAKNRADHNGPKPFHWSSMQQIGGCMLAVTGAAIIGSLAWYYNMLPL
jgi:hypothetical protein